MQVVKYGIVLESLTDKDLELVRSWRNVDHVRLNMKYQNIISQEMQFNWFNSLDKTRNLYFIIKKNAKKIGVVNLKEISWDIGIAEAGIFIGETEYLNTLSPILATICIMEFAFDILNLKSLVAKIGVSNYTAMLFNEGIGYKKQSQQLDNNFHNYEINSENFLEATKNIRETLNKLNASGFELNIAEEEIDLIKLKKYITSIDNIKLNIID